MRKVLEAFVLSRQAFVSSREDEGEAGYTFVNSMAHPSVSLLENLLKSQSFIIGEHLSTSDGEEGTQERELDSSRNGIPGKEGNPHTEKYWILLPGASGPYTQVS